MLAAGRGQRFGALTHTLPKPLLPVLERTLIAWQLEALRAVGVREVVVVVGHLAHRIEAALVAEERDGFVIRAVHQAVPNGIAAALACAAPFLARPFLCVLGDIFFEPQDLRNLSAALKGADGALVAAPQAAPGELARNFAVEVDRAGWARAVEEKPVRATGGWKGIGLYAFRPEFLRVAEETPASGLRGERELTDALARALAAGQRLRAVASTGPDVNVSGPADLLRANLLALSRLERSSWVDPRAELGAAVELERAVVLAGAFVAAGARLQRCLVLSGERVPGGHHSDAVFAAGQSFACPARA